MRIAQAVAGYSAAEADELRRTMGHARKQARLEAALAKLERAFVAKGLKPNVAAVLIGELRGFGNYGFPESHAWSFALIAYATAWLKAHHPTAFYIGLLNAQPMGFYSVATLIHDARRHGVEVRLPCVRLGDERCTLEERDEYPEEPALRVGWRNVRHLSDGAVERLVAARAERPFRSIADVVRRAGLGARDAGALARAHAFATWEPDRRRATWEALRAAGDRLPLAPARPATGDGFAPRPLDLHEAVVADYDAVGLSVAGHPMQRYRAWCDRVGALDSARVTRCRGGERVIVAGLVTVRQRPATAKGVLFLLLEDEHGSVNVIVSPKLDDANREAVRHARFLAVYGRAERNGPLVNVIARAFRALDDAGDRVALAHRSHDFR